MAEREKLEKGIWIGADVTILPAVSFALSRRKTGFPREQNERGCFCYQYTTQPDAFIADAGCGIS